MPLTSSDIQFLNKLLDKHLKAQQSWPWLRWFMLATAAFLIGTGVFAWTLIPSINRALLEFPPGIPATRIARFSDTRPVTEKLFFTLLDSSEQMAMGESRMAANLASLSLAMTIAGGVFILWGMFDIVSTLNRWNRHRRDAILITLLREKCAPELSLSSPTAPPASAEPPR